MNIVNTGWELYPYTYTKTFIPIVVEADILSSGTSSIKGKPIHRVTIRVWSYVFGKPLERKLLMKEVMSDEDIIQLKADADEFIALVSDRIKSSLI